MVASAHHVISKEVEHIWRYTEPTLTMKWYYNIFVQILYSWFRFTPVGSFLDMLSLLLTVILSELHEKPRRNKYWITEKSTLKNLCEGITFLLHSLLSMSFVVAFFVYFLPFPKWCASLLNGPNKDT